MKRHNNGGSFWLSYSDLMTSLFFVMLVLFFVCIIKLSVSYRELQREQQITSTALEEARTTADRLRRITKIEEQFRQLSESSRLAYDDEKKIFYAKDFIGIEIFPPNDDNIISGYLATVDSVGRDLERILRSLREDNPDFRYQLVIEGNAAIPWEELRARSFDADNRVMYMLSYRRALALYNRWRGIGIDLRRFNTEIIIAGSGFNGANRDTEIEDYNKRFVIQIIPKVSRPQI